MIEGKLTVGNVEVKYGVIGVLVMDKDDSPVGIVQGFLTEDSDPADFLPTKLTWTWELFEGDEEGEADTMEKAVEEMLKLAEEWRKANAN